MFKAASLLFLHAETSMHVGSGHSFGTIDLAIQRERHSGFPMVAASGVKGAVRAWFKARGNGALSSDDAGAPEQGSLRARYEAVFGPPTARASDHAGAASFTDARLLLFPIRSAKGVYVWATCPALLGRFARDLTLTGQDVPPEIAQAAVPLSREQVAAADKESISIKGTVMLEEYVFEAIGSSQMRALAGWLVEHALPSGDAYRTLRERLPNHLALLHDDAFSDFSRHATEVQARIALNEDKTTGEGGNLFYQENLPADSLLYTAVLATDARGASTASASDLLAYLRDLDDQFIQIGGDETVGKGLCRARFLDA
jgi:CRISPR-associated protein Cmr4